MKKITKKIEQSMVVIALSLTQITTPILVIAETSEADQPAETTSKIDKEKDPILASSEKEAPHSLQVLVVKKKLILLPVKRTKWIKVRKHQV